MLKRFAAIALLVAVAIPATSFAIPSITAAPTTIVEGSPGVAVGLFFNVFPGDVVTAGGATVLAGSGTTFVSSVELPVGGAATIGGINNPSGPADYGAVFGPNCGSNACQLAVGAHQFATLTVATALGDGGNPAAGLELFAGTFIQAPFCGGIVSNQGATLVSITPVPEPTAVVLIGGALAGLAFLRRKTS